MLFHNNPYDGLEKAILFAPRSFWAVSKPLAEFLELGLTPSDSEKFFTPGTLSLFSPK
jgi:hypothetical protein